MSLNKLFIGLGLLISLSAFSNDSEQLVDLFTGTKVNFAQKILLSAGQRRIEVSPDCEVRLKSGVRGKKHIAEGEQIVITDIDFTPVRTNQNLIEAELTHLTIPKIEISFGRL